jgi:hypothetical protein
VVDCYVVDAPPGSSSGSGGAGPVASSSSSSSGGAGGGDGSGGGAITDMVSFYTLPSSVLGHPEHKEIRAAYMFYTGGWVEGGWRARVAALAEGVGCCVAAGCARHKPQLQL